MKSPIKWIGGKRREIKHFEKYIPKEYDTYIEPFVGGGALYWYLEPKHSIINDINGHLINFYEILRDNHELLHNNLYEYENSKEYFNQVVNKLNNKTYKDKIQQAEIFYYLNKTSFSGKWRVNSKGEYNSSFGYYKTDNYKKLDNIYCDLLKHTEILNTDFKNILEKYKDDKNVFIFLDPPYLECDTFYTKNQNFNNIYEYIHNYIINCKCKVMMVVKETDLLYELFKNNIIDSYNVNYSHNASSKIIHKHIIITNY